MKSKHRVLMKFFDIIKGDIDMSNKDKDFGDNMVLEALSGTSFPSEIKDLIGRKYQFTGKLFHFKHVIAGMIIGINISEAGFFLFVSNEIIPAEGVIECFISSHCDKGKLMVAIVSREGDRVIFDGDFKLLD